MIVLTHRQFYGVMRGTPLFPYDREIVAVECGCGWRWSGNVNGRMGCGEYRLGLIVEGHESVPVKLETSDLANLYAPEGLEAVHRVIATMDRDRAETLFVALELAIIAADVEVHGVRLGRLLQLVDRRLALLPQLVDRRLALLP